jgi:hypothetical protein
MLQRLRHDQAIEGAGTERQPLAIALDGVDALRPDPPSHVVQQVAADVEPYRLMPGLHEPSGEETVTAADVEQLRAGAAR